MSLTSKFRLAFDEIETGFTFSTSEVIDESEMRLFERLSRDHNPLHTSGEYVMSVGLPGRTVYGFLLLSILSRIAGNLFADSVCSSVSADFVAPVYVGDHVAVSAEVMQIQSALRSIVLRFRMIRHSDLVVRGKLTVMFLPGRSLIST